MSRTGYRVSGVGYRRRGRRGVSLVELLAAVIILVIVSAAAAATWSLSSRAPANKRVTDMAAMIGVREIERIKSKKYMNLSNGTTTTYYTKYGAISSVAADNYYRAVTVLTSAVDRDGVANTDDIIQVEVTVSNADGSNPYDTQRTLMAFGAF